MGDCRGRGYPDVAAVGGPVAEVQGGEDIGASGTSASTRKALPFSRLAY